MESLTMTRFEIKFDLKKYRFSNELASGVKIPSKDQRKIKLLHLLGNFDYQILNETEIRVKFRFTLDIVPEVGDYRFDGECIMESPEQETIRHLLDEYPGKLKQAVNKFILKECYYYAEKLAHSENLFFPSVEKILE
jgi:hypothetical protein